MKPPAKVGREAAAELAAALPPGQFLRGEAEILAYAYDSALERARPEAVLLPSTAEQVQAVVKTCLKHKIPYVARGAGTNLSGGCIPLKGGVIVSTARMNRILAVDTAAPFALVEPGVVNLRLQNELERLGWFYAPDPASQKVCTLGGNIAENSGGPRCLKYGVTVNHVLGLELVAPDGSLQRFFHDAPGPDLASLFVGAEGTLGIVTKAWLRLTPLPQEIRTQLAAFASMEDALACVSAIIAAGIVPRCLEAMDKMTLEAVEAHVKAGYPRGAEAVLLIELDGSARKVKAEAEKVAAVLRAHGALEVRSAADAAERERLWEGRRGAYAAMARIAPNVLVEDGVVPRAKLGEALAKIREISAKYQARTGLLFHAGDGNLHPNIVFDERNLNEVKRVKRAGYEILRACVALGGSISGEHGVGVDKRVAMAWLYPEPTLQLFRRVKRAMDPAGLANPDKILPVAAEADRARLLFRPPSRPLSSAAQAVVAKVKAGGSFVVKGRGSRLKARHPGAALDLSKCAGFLELDRADLHATAEAGIELGDLRRRLEAEGYHAPWPKTAAGSLGGLIASKAWPDLRDHVLALRILLADGEVAELGGKVVKNVAGYELGKTLFGSWGAYAVILEATFRIPVEAPAPAKLRAPEPWTEPGPWQRRLKTAFDPENRFNPWLFGGAAPLEAAAVEAASPAEDGALR